MYSLKFEFSIPNWVVHDRGSTGCGLPGLFLRHNPERTKLATMLTARKDRRP
jgi:hypothetical protein